MVGVCLWSHVSGCCGIASRHFSKTALQPYQSIEPEIFSDVLVTQHGCPASACCSVPNLPQHAPTSTYLPPFLLPAHSPAVPGPVIRLVVQGGFVQQFYILALKDCTRRHVLGSQMPGSFQIEADSPYFSCSGGHAFVTPLFSSSLRHAFVTPSEVTPASPAMPERDLRFLFLLLLPLAAFGLQPRSLTFHLRPSAVGLLLSAFSIQPSVSDLQAPFIDQVSR